jgi:tetratricopeptide (TPR) repeat protein
LRRHGATTLLILAALLALSPRVQGAEPAEPLPGSPAAAAREHFDRAQELYRIGSYRDAIEELEAARALDPNAKELVFNLGVVHEKLSEIDEALHFMRLYAEMDLNPAEREKADAYIQRLEGAKRQVAAAHPSPKVEPGAPAEAPAAPEEPPREPEKAVKHGRFDGATLAAVAVVVAGVGVGTFAGITAVSDRPSGFVTGRAGSYASFQDQNDRAHHWAIAADVSFGVAVAGAIAAATLYFARPKDPAPRVTAVLIQGGGGIVWRGSF